METIPDAIFHDVLHDEVKLIDLKLTVIFT